MWLAASWADFLGLWRTFVWEPVGPLLCKVQLVERWLVNRPVRWVVPAMPGHGFRVGVQPMVVLFNVTQDFIFLQ